MVYWVLASRCTVATSSSGAPPVVSKCLQYGQRGSSSRCAVSGASGSPTGRCAHSGEPSPMPHLNLPLPLDQRDPKNICTTGAHVLIRQERPQALRHPENRGRLPRHLRHRLPRRRRHPAPGRGVSGLNAAATLWCSAAVGVLAASGRLEPCVLGTAVVLAAHLLLRPAGRLIGRVPQRDPDNEGVCATARLICDRGDESHARALLSQALTGDVLASTGLRVRRDGEDDRSLGAVVSRGDPARSPPHRLHTTAVGGVRVAARGHGTDGTVDSISRYAETSFSKW